MKPSGFPTHYRQRMRCGAVVSLKVMNGSYSEQKSFQEKVERHLRNCPDCKAR